MILMNKVVLNPYYQNGPFIEVLIKIGIFYD